MEIIKFWLIFYFLFEDTKALPELSLIIAFADEILGCSELSFESTNSSFSFFSYNHKNNILKIFFPTLSFFLVTQSKL